MFRDNLLNAFGEISLKLGIVLQRMRMHELLNSRIRIPLLAIYFVAANVKELVGKQLRHLSDELVEKFISAFASRIHRGIENTPFAFDGIRPRTTRQVWISNKP